MSTISPRPSVRRCEVGRTLPPFLREHGLVFPGGHCSTVELGSYLLQGGRHQVT